MYIYKTVSYTHEVLYNQSRFPNDNLNTDTISRDTILSKHSFELQKVHLFSCTRCSSSSAGSSICKGVTDYDGVVRDVQRSKGMPR